MNWKRFFHAARREFLLCKIWYIVFLLLLLALSSWKLAANYFMQDVASYSVFLVLPLWFLIFGFEADGNRGSYVSELMLPASALEKFAARVAVEAVIPILAVFFLQIVPANVHGTLFAHQASVENTPGNVASLRPDTLECTNFLLSYSQAWRNDSVVSTFHGRFHDVPHGSSPSSDCKVGVSSSAAGDWIYLIGSLGIFYFILYLKMWRKKGRLFSLWLLVPLFIMPLAMVLGMNLVLRSAMSVEAAYNFALIFSIAVGIAGIFSWRRAYKIFSEMGLAR